MVSVLLVGAALAAANVAAHEESPSPDLAAYQAAQAEVGRDPDAHVKLALWCEAHGLQAERVKHLALAVLNDPSHAMARGLMGLVTYRGRWQRPETVGERVRQDEALNAALAEYNVRREKAADTAEAQWRLALWCEEKGLKAEASAHLAAVVRLDPSRDAAWKRLGCTKRNGRWVTEAQLAAEKAEVEARKQGNAQWKPKLARWRNWLGDKNKRDEAEQSLGAVTDPYAVPSVWAVFVEGAKRERDQVWAVQLLGQIDSAGASCGLAQLAVFSDSAEVRRAATETLRGRDTREYLGAVIGLLRKRVKYEVRPVGGPGSPGVLFVEGQEFNVQRLYAPPPLPNIPLFAGESVTYDAAGLPVVSRFLGSGIVTSTVSRTETLSITPPPEAAVAAVRRKGLNPGLFTEGGGSSRTTTETTSTPYDRVMQIPIGQLMLQYQTSAAVALRQQLDDVQVVENYNAVIGRLNDRTTQVLREVTGQDLGEDPQSWTGWWVDQMGYAYKTPSSQPVPTYVENVPLAFVPTGVATPIQNVASGPSNTTTTVQDSSSSGGIRIIHNCFKAGTSVRTLSGPRPIESIQVGDQVLTQDVQSGGLSYQPVLAVFHNRPAATLRIDLEGSGAGAGAGEPIVATTIHRFWKAGQGWAMARDLKPGDVLRTLGGTVRVRSVENDQVQPVFNLQVAQGASFFVGEAGALAHDNSVITPVRTPFDAPPSLAAVASDAR